MSELASEPAETLQSIIGPEQGMLFLGNASLRSSYSLSETVAHSVTQDHVPAGSSNLQKLQHVKPGGLDSSGGQTSVVPPGNMENLACWGRHGCTQLELCMLLLCVHRLCSPIH
jgi:hypothetical protein